MVVRKIRTYGDPVLRKVAQLVEKVDAGIKKLVQDMSGTMYENGGAGLAANQVGVLKQVITVDVGEGLVAFINPRIGASSGREVAEEGCLSIPGICVEVKRAKRIKIRGLSAEGKEIAREAEGLLAQVIQHEIDHLNGILIIDHLSFARLQLLNSQLKGLGQDRQP